MVRIFTFVFSFLCLHSIAQTFSGTGGPILDDGSNNFYTLTSNGVTPATMDTNYGLETVCINLTHTWDDDLVITLIAPDGTEFELSSRNGGDGDNYTNTCFNYSAATPIYLSSPPFTGTFKPEGTMSMVNNGQNANGLWTLHILDTYPFADQGDLLNWSITFGDQPAKPFPFSFANLPLVVISTHGVVIPNDPKIPGEMRIIKNPNNLPNHVTDSANVYSGKIGIELRGHSAQGMPKRSYSLETRSNNVSSLDVSLLGMPAENDWVLIANYSDKSLLRNYYTYFMYRKMGHWAPRMEFCEVMIDGEYQGIYLLGEKIKRGGDRVDIHSISVNDTIGSNLSGGYIFKIDWEDPGDIGWNSNYTAVNATNNLKYLFVYPKPENVKPAQIAYMKSYVDSFESVMYGPQFADSLTGYRQYIDEQSFIDYIILTEYTKNVDGLRLSTYFYKDRDGKITAGPPWDYDLSWGNADYLECYLPTGWDYIVQQSYTNQCAFWWQRFFQDPLFQNRLRCRWTQLHQDILNPVTINHELDSLANVLGVSTALNFTKWPILGIYVWPNPAPIPTTYTGEIEKIKDWATLRTTWLENHWPGSCNLYSGINDENSDVLSTVFPNPNDGSFQLVISGTEQSGKVDILDITGKKVYSSVIESQQTDFATDLKPGIYFLRYEGKTMQWTKKLIVR